MKVGFVFRLYSFWVGIHYSPYNQRVCINFIPFCTIWIVWGEGKPPIKQKI